MKIAFLGSRGLIGRAIYQKISGDHDVQKLGRGPAYDIDFDLFAPEKIGPSMFEGCDVLVHCAGVVDEDFLEASPQGYIKGTWAAKKMVDAAYSAGVRRFVYVSSAHVYGPLEGAINEENASFPLSDYAIAHYATEQIFKRIVYTACEDTDALILRPCATYGMLENPEQFRRWSLVPFNFPKQAVDNQKISLSAGSDCVRRNFVGADSIGMHVRDFLKTPISNGSKVVNPVGTDNLSIYEFARRCADIYEHVTGHTTCSVEMPEGSPAPRSSSGLEYGSVYDYQPQGQSLDEYLRAMITWLGDFKHSEFSEFAGHQCS